MSQFFYAWRIWVFSSKIYVPIVVIVVSTVSGSGFDDSDEPRFLQLSLFQTVAGLYGGVITAIGGKYSECESVVSDPVVRLELKTMLLVQESTYKPASVCF